MRTFELAELIRLADKDDNLEVKIEPRLSMNDNEQAGDILVERIVTPDYIRITKIYERKPINVRAVKPVEKRR